jgi:hypothetical protein
MFDFDQSRLYAVSNDLSSPYTHYNVRSFSLDPSPARQSFRPLSMGNLFQRSYPVYFTGHSACGLPYVYFDSRSYATDWENDIVFAATSTTGNDCAASPYITSVAPPNPTWTQRHANADTFQIIAAGKDGSYGNTQAAFPDKVGNPPPPNGYWSASDAGNAPGHADNITNFASGALADAIETLKSQ